MPPRPHPSFASFSACAISLLNPIVPPFLAPQAFAPWPQELLQRSSFHSSPRTCVRSKRLKTLKTLQGHLKTTSLEDSDLLAKALSGEGDTQKFFEDIGKTWAEDDEGNWGYKGEEEEVGHPSGSTEQADHEDWEAEWYRQQGSSNGSNFDHHDPPVQNEPEERRFGSRSVLSPQPGEREKDIIHRPFSRKTHPHIFAPPIAWHSGSNAGSQDSGQVFPERTRNGYGRRNMRGESTDVPRDPERLHSQRILKSSKLDQVEEDFEQLLSKLWVTKRSSRDLWKNFKRRENATLSSPEWRRITIAYHSFSVEWKVIRTTCNSLLHKWNRRSQRWGIPQSALQFTLESAPESAPEFAPHSALQYIPESAPEFAPEYAPGSLAWAQQRELRRQQGEKKYMRLKQGVRKILLTRDMIEYMQKQTDVDIEIYRQMLLYDGPELAAMYNNLPTTGTPINQTTRKLFVHHLARKGETQTAVEALGALYENGADFLNPRIMQLCATLLQNRYRKNLYAPPTDFEIFDRMVAYGLQPNTLIYNILMHNSSQRNDHESVNQILEEMKVKGLEVDNFTHSILINDAKRRKDWETVQKTFLAANENQILDEFILADLLHAIYLLQMRHVREIMKNRTEDEKEEIIQEEDTNSIMSPMLDFYRQYFITQPLFDLIPANRKALMPAFTEDSPEAPKNDLLMPDHVIIHIMYSVILHDVREPDVALEYFRHFQNLLDQKHPTAHMLVNRGNAIYDLFLKSLGRWEETLGTCAEVLQNMMTPPPGSLRDLQPTVISWSILLKSFMKHGQPLAAEKVLQMMQDRDIAPTEVTWTYLVQGYARLQNIQGALDARERMAMAGWELEAEHTKLDQLIKNREALHSILIQRAKDHEEFDAQNLETSVDEEQYEDGQTNAERLWGSDDELDDRFRDEEFYEERSQWG